MFKQQNITFFARVKLEACHVFFSVLLEEGQIASHPNRTLQWLYWYNLLAKDKCKSWSYLLESVPRSLYFLQTKILRRLSDQPHCEYRFALWDLVQNYWVKHGTALPLCFSQHLYISWKWKIVFPLLTFSGGGGKKYRATWYKLTITIILTDHYAPQSSVLQNRRMRPLQ